MSSKNEVITILGMCYQCKDVAGNALSSTHMLIIAVVGHIVHDHCSGGAHCPLSTTAVNCQHIDPYVDSTWMSKLRQNRKMNF